MRVVGGALGGRRLLGPPRGAHTRPTSDKVREAVFNILGDEGVRGARALDVFAGTGALGIEALSRGAARATFVDVDRGMCATIEANLEALEVADRGRVVCRDARRAAKSLGPDAPFDLVFLDPPYGHGLELEVLSAVTRAGLLAPGARVVVEHASRESLALPPELASALVEDDTRTYGDTAVSWYTARAPAPSAARTTMARVAIYPGSFDPLTNGHLDLIHRAAALFDTVVIAVASNVRKNALFTTEERVDAIREVVRDNPRIEVDTFDGLLVAYAKRRGAGAVVRGLRAVADFEYEFEMASMNKKLAPDVETVFLMTHEAYFYVSSHLVKEVAALGGDVSSFVPPLVAERLRGKLGK